VVVHNLDVIGIAACPTEADPELIVHPHTPLARAIAFQSFKTIPGRCAQIVNSARQIELL
jgi:hypothetical protein